MGGIDTLKQEITQRFLATMEQIIKNHQLGKQKNFADVIGVENYQISNLNIGKSQVNAWMIAAMADKYPEANLDYILNGRGEMIRKTKVLEKDENLWDYIELLQEENTVQKKQIKFLQTLLKEARIKPETNQDQ